MTETEYEKLIEITRQLTNFTFVLKYFCLNFGVGKQKSTKLIEISNMLDKKAISLYDLF